MIPPKTFYSWGMFLDDMYHRALPLLEPHAREFTGVIGLPRGGLMMAVIISHQLEIPLFLWGQSDPTLKNLIGGSTRGAEYEHHMTKYVSSWPLDPKILVADDIADTGKRLAPYADVGHSIITLFYHRKSIVTPRWWFNEKTAEGGFIVFPYEKEQPLR